MFILRRNLLAYQFDCNEMRYQVETNFFHIKVFAGALVSSVSTKIRLLHPDVYKIFKHEIFKRCRRRPRLFLDPVARNHAT